MEYFIRRIEERDNKQIEDVIRACLIEYGADHEGTAWADPMLGNLYAVYRGEKEAYWVCEADGEIVAGVGIGPVEFVTDTCELQKMYCRPEMRGSKIAEKLLKKALSFAGNYYKKCYLETLDNMIRAQRFYEKHGFRRIWHPIGNTGHYSCDVRYLKSFEEEPPLEVKWSGTASFFLRAGEDIILIDPYLRKHSGKGSAITEELGTVKAIFITHPHLDHFADIREIMERSAASVYVCKKGIESAEKNGIPTEKMLEISPGESVKAGRIQVTAFQSRHCVFDRGVIKDTLHRLEHFEAIREGLKIMDENHRFRIGEKDILAYCIETDHQTVFLLGSANIDESVQYPKQMDLLVYPYQGRSDMAEYSLPFLECFRPKKVMLSHFDDAFPPISREMDGQDFCRRAKDVFPDMEIIVPKENHWYTLPFCDEVS